MQSGVKCVFCRNYQSGRHWCNDAARRNRGNQLSQLRRLQNLKPSRFSFWCCTWN